MILLAFLALLFLLLCACLALPGFLLLFFTFLLLVLLWRIVSLFKLLLLSTAFVAVTFC